MIPLNDLSRQVAERQHREIEVAASVLVSGHYIKGSRTEELESALSALIGGSQVLAIANGTDALMLAMLGLGLKPGDKVATVGNAGGYSSTAAVRIGLQPVLIDIDSNSAQMSCEDLEQAFKKGSIQAVVVTHLYGQLADVETIRELCDRYNVYLIEDCAQAIGARRNGKAAGSWGDASTFSFYPTKNLGAIGDAGAVAFKVLEHYETARSFSQYGWTSRYEISIAGGFNSRIDEIQAAILLERLPHLDEDNAKRREIIKIYSSSLTGERRMLGQPDESFVGHLAVLVTTNRASDVEKLHSQGVATGIHYPILDNKQKAWKEQFTGTEIPNSEILVNQILTIPCFPLMSDGEVHQVATALSSL